LWSGELELVLLPAHRLAADRESNPFRPFFTAAQVGVEFEPDDDDPDDHDHDRGHDHDHNHDHDDDVDYTALPSFLMALTLWNMPQLSSLNLAFCFDDYTETSRDSLIFPKRFAIFLSHCQLPALRRVTLRLIYLPEMAVASMTKALSTFFSRHQDLDHVVLSGFRAHVAHVARRSWDHCVARCHYQRRGAVLVRVR
jgi:hypothetical protein